MIREVESSMNFSPDTKEKFDIVVNTYRLLGFKETLKEVCPLSLKPKTEGRLR